MAADVPVTVAIGAFGVPDAVAIFSVYEVAPLTAFHDACAVVRPVRTIVKPVGAAGGSGAACTA
jgi:hypothetical protein